MKQRIAKKVLRKCWLLDYTPQQIDRALRARRRLHHRHPCTFDYDRFQYTCGPRCPKCWDSQVSEEVWQWFVDYRLRRLPRPARVPGGWHRVIDLQGVPF